MNLAHVMGDYNSLDEIISSVREGIETIIKENDDITLLHICGFLHVFEFDPFIYAFHGYLYHTFSLDLYGDFVLKDTKQVLNIYDRFVDLYMAENDFLEEMCDEQLSDLEEIPQLDPETMN